MAARLRKQSYQLRHRGLIAQAADLRLASICARRLAATILACQAQMETDPLRKRDLEARGLRRVDRGCAMTLDFEIVWPVLLVAAITFTIAAVAASSSR